MSLLVDKMSPMGYLCKTMYEILLSDTFSRWLRKLDDRQARARINDRLLRMQGGNLGDIKSLGDGLSEARITYGPGYRLYFIRRGQAIIVMLAGGDKSSQARDIKSAKQMAEEWRKP